MKVAGYERHNFSVEGQEIHGYYVYLSRPLSGTDCKGQAFDRIYITDRKLEASGLVIADCIGKTVLVVYNRFGKVQRLALDG